MPDKTPNRVGLGTFPLANVFAPVDKNKAKNIVRTFLDNGGYYFDCAPMYGFGEVEVLLGEVFKDCHRIYISDPTSEKSHLWLLC